MRILAITARYPPYHFGGYEIRCKNILDELANRGHKIEVISSIKETQTTEPGYANKYKILRKFHIRKKARHFINELSIDWQDTAFLDRQIKYFQPDVIYLGHIQPLSKAIFPYLTETEIPLVYDEGGIGLVHTLKNRGLWSYFVDEYVSSYSMLNMIKPLVVKIVCIASENRIKLKWDWPRNMSIFFNSELNLKNAIANGVPIDSAKVIHSGIDTEKFSFVSKTELNSPLLILVPGRIESLKGQLDAVRLLASLRECEIDGNMVIVGENFSKSYYLEIENEIRELNLQNKITLMPMVAHDKLIDMYQNADICLFPSYFRTGYSRIPIEAMACGCIIISYGNEGSDEIIKDKETGFLALPGDFSVMANTIKELLSNPEMVKVMSNKARKQVEENCSMQKYVDQIERILINAEDLQ